VLGLLLMSHAKGQVVVPDFGFYGRDIHSRLIREDRLIAGVNFLSELPEKLRRTALLINKKLPSGTTVDDAEELAKYERLARGTNGFMDFVAKAFCSEGYCIEIFSEGYCIEKSFLKATISPVSTDKRSACLSVALFAEILIAALPLYIGFFVSFM
jgi:hypothetical protein